MDKDTKVMIRMINELKKLEAAWMAVFREMDEEKLAKEKKDKAA